MKAICLLCLIFLCLGGAWAQTKPQKHALLVGISSYRNLPALPGAKNDVTNMKDLLVKKMGFSQQQIVVLEDEAATRAAILNQIEQLIQRVGPNDTAVFHFSGHGSQMKDLSGDEEDGLDETLVPYDSRDPDIYDISDDEINLRLTRLTQRCSNVTFIFDSCHSSTGQRPGSWRKVDADQRMPVMGTAKAEKQAAPFGGIEANNYVMIAACGSTQVAGEIDVDGLRQGALTHYLAKALRQVEANTIWNQVLEEVRRGVHQHYRGQTPMIHGRGDRVIFGVLEIPSEPHILVSPGRGNQLELAAGLVHGLTPGSVFNLYTAKRGTKQDLIGRAKLKEVSHFSSRAQLLEGGPVHEGDWAVESEHEYLGKQLLLYIEKPVAQALLRELKKYTTLALVDDPAKAQLVIAHDSRKHRFQLKDQDGIAMGAALDDADVKAACQKIHEWGRWFNVLSIESQGPTTPKLAFSINKKGDVARSEPDPIDSPETVFREGDRLVFKASNLSQQKIYMTLLALSSSGEIVQLFPAKGEDQPIPPGGSNTLVLDATVSAGYDIEKTVIKLFATLQRIDLSFLEQPGATRRGANPHPLEVLVDGGARGGKMRPARWTALNKVLLIKKSDVK